LAGRDVAEPNQVGGNTGHERKVAANGCRLLQILSGGLEMVSGVFGDAEVT